MVLDNPYVLTPAQARAEAFRLVLRGFKISIPNYLKNAHQFSRNTHSKDDLKKLAEVIIFDLSCYEMEPLEATAELQITAMSRFFFNLQARVTDRVIQQVYLTSASVLATGQWMFLTGDEILEINATLGTTLYPDIFKVSGPAPERKPFVRYKRLA